MSQEEKQLPDNSSESNADETAVFFKVTDSSSLSLQTSPTQEAKDKTEKEHLQNQSPLAADGSTAPVVQSKTPEASEGVVEMQAALTSSAVSMDGEAAAVTPLEIMQSKPIPIFKMPATNEIPKTTQDAAVVKLPTADQSAASATKIETFQEMPSQPIPIMGLTSNAATQATSSGTSITGTPIAPTSTSATPTTSSGTTGTPITGISATSTNVTPLTPLTGATSSSTTSGTATPIAPISSPPASSTGGASITGTPISTSGTPIAPLSSAPATAKPITPISSPPTTSVSSTSGASITGTPAASSATTSGTTATPIKPITPVTSSTSNQSGTISPLVPPTVIPPSSASSTSQMTYGDVTVAHIPVTSSGQKQIPTANIPTTETASKMPIYTTVQPTAAPGEITNTHNSAITPNQPVSGGDVTVSVRQINPSTTVISPTPITASPTPVPITSLPTNSATQAGASSGAATGTTQIPTWLTTSVSATKFVSNLTPAQQIRRALSLSSVLVELRSRIIEANIRGPEKMVSTLSDGYWLASTWRGLFQRAVGLHTELLGDFEVDLARYNMSFGRPRYLNAGFAFVNIGIEPTGAKFSIAEKLRQTLNFLTALYQKHELWHDIVDECYKGDDPFLVLPEGKDKYLYLIDDLTSQVDNLLTAWDNYVRERLFATSSTMLSARYAYSAGRALTELSWNLTIQVAPFREESYRAKFPTKYDLANAVYQHWIQAFNPQNISYLQRQLSALINVLEEEYLGVRANEEKLGNRSQEEIVEQASDLKSPRASINALIQSLEYWQTTVAELSTGGVLQRVTIKTAPDYRNMPSWSEKFDLHPDWAYENLMDLRLALIEEWANWFALASGRQDLTSFRAVNVASELLQDYSQQITRMASGNLQQAFKEIQAEITELATTGVTATKDVAKAGIKALGDVLNSKWLWIGLGAAVITVVVVGTFLAFANSGGKTPDFTTVIASIVSTLLGAFGIGAPGAKAVRDGQQQVAATGEQGVTQIADKTKSAQAKTDQSVNVGALVLTTVGQVRDYLEQAFRKGYEQLQKELGLISATLAVTSPLVEWVVRNCDTQNDMEFLSTVIWNDQVRRSQLNRIVIAAFGPVGAFFIASSESNKTEEQTATSLEVPPTDSKVK